MLNAYLVTVYYLALEITIDLVEVETVSAWDERLSFEDICTKLIDVASCTWEVTCRLDTS